MRIALRIAWTKSEDSPFSEKCGSHAGICIDCQFRIFRSISIDGGPSDPNRSFVESLFALSDSSLLICPSPPHPSCQIQTRLTRSDAPTSVRYIRRQSVNYVSRKCCANADMDNYSRSGLTALSRSEEQLQEPVWVGALLAKTMFGYVTAPPPQGESEG
jgi:hypothetical protein